MATTLNISSLSPAARRGIIKLAARKRTQKSIEAAREAREKQYEEARKAAKLPRPEQPHTVDRRFSVNSYDTDKPGAIVVHADHDHKPSPYCICERQLYTNETNVALIDKGVRQWTRERGYPADWFAQIVRHFSFGEDLDSRIADDLWRWEKRKRYNPATKTWSEKLVRIPGPALRGKNRIEERCPASIHYPNLLLDTMYAGHPVYTSQDEEKDIENRDRSEYQMFLDSHPAARRELTENRGADALGGKNDVLTRQREARMNQSETTTGTAVQLSFDAEQATDTAERKALRTISRESGKPDAWTRLVWANKRRIRAKEQQARRDLWYFVKKHDLADTPEVIAQIARDVKRQGYHKTLQAFLDTQKEVATL